MQKMSAGWLSISAGDCEGNEGGRGSRGSARNYAAWEILSSSGCLTPKGDGGGLLLAPPAHSSLAASRRREAFRRR